MADANYLIWAGLAAAMVGLSKGGLPTVGMLSVPILSLFMSPVKAVVMLLPIYIISDMVGLWLYRKNFSAINLKILIPAGVGGVLVGWLTASLVSDTAVKMMIGLLGVGFVLNAWRKRHAEQAPKSPSWRQGMLWGSLSGFTSFISHAGGPPFQVYLLPQQLSKLVFAGTSTLFFCLHQLGQTVALSHAATLWPQRIDGRLGVDPVCPGGHCRWRLPHTQDRR
jgi:uncharacterized membrane protein YfcA